MTGLRKPLPAALLRVEAHLWDEHWTLETGDGVEMPGLRCPDAVVVLEGSRTNKAGMLTASRTGITFPGATNHRRSTEIHILIRYQDWPKAAIYGPNKREPCPLTRWRTFRVPSILENSSGLSLKFCEKLFETLGSWEQAIFGTSQIREEGLSPLGSNIVLSDVPRKVLKVQIHQLRRRTLFVPRAILKASSSFHSTAGRSTSGTISGSR